MPTKLAVYTNEDDALLVWSVAAPIPQCLGFAVQRRLTRAGKTTESWLINRVGFAKDKPTAGETRPSTEWPFQRFTWTDHDVNTGDQLSYNVVPMTKDAAGKLQPLTAEQSGWSKAHTLGDTSGSAYEAFFNRGFVMSQFMSRYLKESGKTLQQFKDTIRDEDDKTIRKFLSGDLRTAILGLLKEAKSKGGHIYAALFELSDDELIDGLVALGARAHIVLANGSVQKKKGETSAQARKRDENDEARARLIKAGVDVEADNRFISPGALGHNKFLVLTSRAKKPVAALTGSTNWAPTGLCTQVNNGLVIRDAAVADVYMKQWQLLRQSKSDFPDDLLDSNSKPKPVGKDKPGAIRSTVWFTRTRKEVDLAALRAEVQRAKQGILFLMFMPGATGLLGTVQEMAKRPELYVRGVVSTLPSDSKDETNAQVSLIDGSTQRDLSYEIIQPQGIAHSFAYWAAEVTRQQFLGSVGHAIIHSKVVVIDPFSDDPTVITGSHNFSSSASGKNDENFIIVRGDHALAEAYAVNALGVWNHYRWRAHIATTKKPWQGLSDKDTWMKPSLAAQRKQLAFWGV